MAQKCSMAIIGESNYAQKILAHMCCGFPLNQRGGMPHRCACPPYVKIEQFGFDCKKGNELMCIDPTGVLYGGDITRPLNDPSNMLGANLSLKQNAFLRSTNVHFYTSEFHVKYTPESSMEEVRSKEQFFITKAKEVICSTRENYPYRKIDCPDPILMP